MANVRRRKARRKARINSTLSARKLKKKHKVKIHISEQCIRDRWDKKKTLKQNLSDMGLAMDPNVAVSIATAKPTEDECTASMESVQETPNDLLAELEALSQPTTRKKKFNHFSLSEAKLLARLIHEHNTNYKKMARDKCNIFQLTEAQLRRKCMDLQRSSFSYLLEDEDSVMEEKEEEEDGRED